MDTDEAAHDAEVTYPMRVVSRLTGVAAETVRAWERRYEAIAPLRSAGNTRMFTSADVRRLTLLRELTEQGHGISGIAHLDIAGLRRLLDEAKPTLDTPSDPSSAERALIEGYLDAIEAFAPRRAEDILSRAAAVMPSRAFVFDVVLPILRAVGERWAHARVGVAQEHLVSAQVTGLLATLTRMHAPDPGASTIVVTTPAGQRHGFGAVVGALLAAIRGFEVVYLGVDLPDADILWAVEASRADVLLLVTQMPPDAPALGRMGALFDALPSRLDVWVGGAPEALPSHPRARGFSDFEALDLALAERGR